MAIVSDQLNDLTQKEYKRIADLVYRVAGINLGEQKMQLVRSRLGKRIRERGLSTYTEYIDLVEADASGQELSDLLDAISTNTTHLFRENAHFEFLRGVLDELVQAANGRQSVCRIWSAACSSGEEPYSIAITADDALQKTRNVQVKILATDISTSVLASAQAGVFAADRMAAVPTEFRSRYFKKNKTATGETFEADPKLRNMITFSHFNLMSEKFPFRNKFDVIFCRNVMIYFDKPTQEGLVNRFARHLRPGGYLLIGHSESLNSVKHPYNYVRPTVYQLPQ
ncbi:MAG: protein-glutamate O-methyltransferase [Phycisphaerales bacterium]|nr:protein-glutamate O-methyltransferase [Phycisphaerales bacterium]